MDTFNDYIQYFSENFPKNDEIPTQAILLAEALFTTQKILNQSVNIKSAISSKRIAVKSGKLLVLCAKLEMINSSLVQIMHEYNL